MKKGEIMLINSQGFEHYLQQINNQDFAFETSRMLLVLDGSNRSAGEGG